MHLFERDKTEIINQIDDLLEYSDKTIRPLVSPDNWWAFSNLFDDLEQLKITVEQKFEQREPKMVIKDMYGNSYCPHCSSDALREMGACKLHMGTIYCPYCGNEVKWNG